MCHGDGSFDTLTIIYECKRNARGKNGNMCIKHNRIKYFLVDLTKMHFFVKRVRLQALQGVELNASARKIIAQNKSVIDLGLI